MTNKIDDSKKSEQDPAVPDDQKPPIEEGNNQPEASRFKLLLLEILKDGLILLTALVPVYLSLSNKVSKVKDSQNESDKVLKYLQSRQNDVDVRQIKIDENTYISILWQKKANFKCWPIPLTEELIWGKYSSCLGYSNVGQIKSNTLKDNDRVTCLSRNDIGHCKSTDVVPQVKVDINNEIISVINKLPSISYLCETLTSLTNNNKRMLYTCINLGKHMERETLIISCLTENNICMKKSAKGTTFSENEKIKILIELELSEKYSCNEFVKNDPKFNDYLGCFSKTRRTYQNRLECLIKIGKCTENK
ncbi:hypothetical protein KKF34_11085 [Myxococcota bacterium]|nr:hypothetical protein [Myxococcota bacterium]MBU1381533.1 hypothetical protein [Myxococcota bacterium]MBU1497408.1 hypothetical protein [Myxococcota bacterium]